MNSITIARFVIAEMLAVEVQRQDAENLALRQENQHLKNEVMYAQAALRASEESHENLTRSVIEEVTGG